MPQFHIIRIEREGQPPVMDGSKPLVWEDPKEAQKQAAQLQAAWGEKVCVKLVINEEWRTREEKRMSDKDYRPLPWFQAMWWIDAYPIWKDHFPHASLEKPGFLAYTKCVEDGVKDKQTIVRPGAYLGKYFERALENNGLIQRKLVEQFMALYGPIEVKFAETEDDMQAVYERGPQTCIHGRNWPKGLHPARVYAGGDLQIAYIGELGGKVSARSLVWPEKKLHSRIYGDVARLTQGLQRLGYQWGPPVGAKLKRVELNCNGKQSHVFLAPYIDKKNQQGGGHLGVIDKGDHLIICLDNEPGSHHASLPDGYSGNYVPRKDEKQKYVCQSCDANVNFVTDVFIGAHGEDEEPDSYRWCYRCVQDNAWRCRYSGHFYSTEDVESVEVAGNRWLEYYADMYATRCEADGQLYPEGDVRKVHMPDGEEHNYSTYYCDRALGGVFRSEITKRFYPKKEAVTVLGEFGSLKVPKAELKHHAFQCDGCSNYWVVRHRNQVDGSDKLMCPQCFVASKNNAVVAKPSVAGMATPY